MEAIIRMVTGEGKPPAYGLFGFEFFMNKGSSICYFIELGSMGVGARAKLSGKPFYANGFSTSAGLRMHL